MHPIVFENVAKYYGKTAALDEISLVLPAGVTSAVIGPSGSGKSTLLETINGLVFPDKGNLQVFGTPIDYENLTALRRRIGYALQGTGLFPHLTVRRNISLLATLEKWSRVRIEARIAELLELVNLPSGYLYRFPHELSGGERQRVGLCRAIMLDPAIFLLDEAFGALDPITRSEIHQAFLKLQRLRPRTIVLVTHDLREAIKLADFIVIMDDGHIEQCGTKAEILSKPANTFVERFVQNQLDHDFQVYKR
jgi:osmoprotectant transport system ATP-binding protein